MAPKKNSTPINPLEGSTMTYEDEEWQHDISKLQEQVQQSSLSQRETKSHMEVLKKCVESKIDGMGSKIDGMEAGMESKIDGMEAKIDEKMENMKNDIKEDMEGLTKLIQ